jgi:hypothetical protein
MKRIKNNENKEHSGHNIHRCKLWDLKRKNSSKSVKIKLSPKRLKSENKVQRKKQCFLNSYKSKWIAKIRRSNRR